MRGFALPGSTRLYSLHDIIERATRSALAAVEKEPRIERCYVGETLNCKKALPLAAMSQAATYAAKESRLDLFFMPPPAPTPPPGQVAVPPPPPPDPLETYRISILVTDGMATRAPGATSGGPCLAGADPECIGYLLQQRVQQGYGIWMAILYLPFQGLHFAERPLDESHWERLRQHLQALANDPYFPGVSFQARRPDRRVPFTSFWFEGVKPLLILALSRDISVGRRWLVALRDFIEREALPDPPRGLYTMELAPLSLPSSRIEKFSLDPHSTLTNMRYVSATRRSNYFDALIECQRNGTGRFRLTRTTNPAEAYVGSDVSHRWTWDFIKGGLSSAKGQSARSSESGSEPPGWMRLEATTEGDDILEIACPKTWLEEVRYEAWWALRPQIEVRPQTGQRPFWTDLHADTIYEAPERFFGLRNVVEAVLQAVARQRRTADCLRIRVEYKR
jgi:hypothetical protein